MGPELKIYNVKMPVIALVEASSEFNAKVMLATYLERKAGLVDASSSVSEADAFESEPLDSIAGVLRER